ncbi:MAG: NF038122 family metalloprotease [Rivularia sp. (in: Bacteria)]|nr:NF038122 family metalloprotease [Rivularia sp. MS3]
MKTNKSKNNKNSLFSKAKLLLQSLLSVSTGLIATNLPANALNFNFTYGSQVTYEQMLGFEMAGKYWSHYLKDDFTINMFIDSTGNLPENVIGGALPGMKSYSYNFFQNKFNKDKSSRDDNLAFDSFNNGRNDDYHVMVDGKEIEGINKVNMTRANAKALGLISGNHKEIDGYIMISNLDNINGNFSWNYDYLNHEVSANKLDFFSMAVHEIGHNLGFVSSGDNLGFRKAIKESQTTNQKITATKINESITVLDLYRYSYQSKKFVHSVDKQKGIPDISIGGKPFFSDNRGEFNIGELSSGEDSEFGGNGYQASHWKPRDGKLGIMDPLLRLGQRRQTTFEDRNAMDVLGWDVDMNANIFDVINWDVPYLSNYYWQQTYHEAKHSLAEKMGIPTWLMEIAPEWAASLLSWDWIDNNDNSYDDRYEELDKMLEDSGSVYKWGWGTGYSQKTLASNTSMLWQHMTWQKVDLSRSNSIAVKSTPEPTSLFGLLGLSLLGIISRSRSFSIASKMTGK